MRFHSNFKTGITSKLQYLKDLGVEALWLSPIYPSPQADFGYDISDFKGIDPQYGSMKDFETLLERAHELGKCVEIMT